MYSYSYMPQRKNQVAPLVVLTLFAVGIALMYLSQSLPSPFILQIVSIGMLAIAVFLTTRYSVRKYAYSVIKVGDDYDFAVNEIQGKKSTVVCRFSTDEISSFEKAEKNGKFPKSIKSNKGRGILKYDYCQDMLPQDAYVIVAELREGVTAVKISPDEKLAGIIETLRPKNE